LLNRKHLQNSLQAIKAAYQFGEVWNNKVSFAAWLKAAGYLS